MLQGRKEEKRDPEQPKIFPHDTVYVARVNHPRQFNLLIGISMPKIFTRRLVYAVLRGHKNDNPLLNGGANGQMS